jgi:tartrate-resistant acid phosphatase type 5
MRGTYQLAAQRRARARSPIQAGIASAGLVLGALLLCLGLVISPAQAGHTAANSTFTYLPLMLTPAIPPPDDLPDYVRFAVIGDYGNASDNEATVARLVRSWRPGFIITVGDNNYGDDKIENIDPRVGQFYAEYIFPYHGTYGPGATSNRFYPTLGNHDWNAEGRTAYHDYFTLPGNERYYDVVRGPVHLFALSSDPREPDGVTSDSIQGRWGQAALAASTNCWNLVYFHHPPFSSGDHGSSDWMQWPFKSWGADLVLAGHEHSYERLSIDGFPYIVNGLGGASRYDFKTPLAGSLVRYNDTYGAMLVEATRTTITYRFIAIDGTDVDTFTQHGGCG